MISFDVKQGIRFSRHHHQQIHTMLIMFLLHSLYIILLEQNESLQVTSAPHVMDSLVADKVPTVNNYARGRMFDETVIMQQRAGLKLFREMIQILLYLL